MLQTLSGGGGRQIAGEVANPEPRQSPTTSCPLRALPSPYLPCLSTVLSPTHLFIGSSRYHALDIISIYERSRPFCGSRDLLGAQRRSLAKSYLTKDLPHPGLRCPGHPTPKPHAQRTTQGRTLADSMLSALARPSLAGSLVGHRIAPLDNAQARATTVRMEGQDDNAVSPLQMPI